MTSDRVALVAVTVLTLAVLLGVAFQLGRHVERVAQLAPRVEQTLTEAVRVTAALDTLHRAVDAACWVMGP